MSNKAMELLDVYTNEMLKQEEQSQAHKVAGSFSYKEKEYRERMKSDDKSGGKKTPRRMTMAPQDSNPRTELFKTPIEQATIGLKEMLRALSESRPIKIASLTYYPQAYLLDKLSDKISEKIKSFFHFPSLPSRVKFLINSYIQALTNVDPGFDIPALVKEILYNLR